MGDTPTSQRISTLSDWDKISALFTNIGAISPKASWIRTGMSERIGPRRVQALLRSSKAARLHAILKTKSAKDLRRLHVAARVNLEQAQAASRVTILLNVTLLIGAFMLSNQISPGWIAEKYALSDISDRIFLIFMLTLFIFISSIVAAYSWGGVAAARDLLHLLELHLADLDDGRLETGRSYPDGDPISDLRGAQLSEL